MEQIEKDIAEILMSEEENQRSTLLRHEYIRSLKEDEDYLESLTEYPRI